MKWMYEHLPTGLDDLRLTNIDSEFKDSSICPQNDLRQCKKEREKCCLGESDKPCAKNCPNNQANGYLSQP